MCRAGVSAGAEAAVILLSYPNAAIGSGKSWSTGKGDKRLGVDILQAIFCLLRLQEGVYDFDVNDPVPDGDKVFDVDNVGLHVIFNAARDDPLYEHPRGKLDVVSDGNFQCNRKLAEREKKVCQKESPWSSQYEKERADIKEDARRCQGQGET